MESNHISDKPEKGNEGLEREPRESQRQKEMNKAPNVTQTFTLTAKEKKTILRILYIIGVLYIFSSPLLSTYFYYVSNGYDAVFAYYLSPWATTIFLSSEMINAYIYCYKNEHFRLRRPAIRRPASLSGEVHGLSRHSNDTFVKTYRKSTGTSC